MQLQNLHSFLNSLTRINMIHVTFSNNTTWEFPTVSQASDYSLAMLINGQRIVRIRSNNASSQNHLQDYFAGILKSINLKGE